MPGDNSATVGGGTAVQFPQDGPASGGITRVPTGGATGSNFILPNIGIYSIAFQVSVDEKEGQLVVALNGVDQKQTIVGRDTGTSQIVGKNLLMVTEVNSIISINNPVGNGPALTITPIAGGKDPVSAHLVITQIQ